MKNEIDRDAPLTLAERAAAGVAILWTLLFSLALTLLAGCGKSVDVEGDGMYANANSGVVGIGSFEVVTYPEGVEGARIKYEEDTAWLSPSTKTHAFKIDIVGSNSCSQVSGVVSNICAAFVATAPQIAAINSGEDASAPTNAANAEASSYSQTSATESVRTSD